MLSFSKYFIVDESLKLFNMTLTTAQMKSFDNSEIDGRARNFDSSNLVSKFVALDPSDKKHLKLFRAHAQTDTVTRTLVNAETPHCVL